MSPQICLNCGDNRAVRDGLCDECHEHMMSNGFRGDGL